MIDDHRESEFHAYMRRHQPTRFMNKPVEKALPHARVNAEGALLYARTSTTLQYEASIEEQFAVQEAYFDALGITVIGRIADRGISGMTIAGRPGLSQLLRQVAAGGCEAMGVATLCRLARTERVMHHIIERLLGNDVRLHDVATGPVDELGASIYGALAAEERRLMLARRREGLFARLDQGYGRGRPPIGYLPVPEVTGLWVLHPKYRFVVRFIFEQAAAGRTSAEIASMIDCPTPLRWIEEERNPNTVPPGGWQPEMVIALLRNPIYAGIVAYGTTESVCNPATLRPLRVQETPLDQWHVRHVPHLQIVDRELWENVQGLLTKQSKRHGGQPGKGLLMLSGRVHCSSCGHRIMGPFDHSSVAAAFRCRSELHAACRETIATVGVVERGVLHLIRDLLRNAPTEPVYSPSEGREAQRAAELERLDDILRGEIERLHDKVGDVVADDRMLWRRRSLRRLITIGSSDLIDIQLLLERIDLVLQENDIDPIKDPMRELFDAIRILVPRVSIGVTGGRINLVVELDLGPVSSQLDAADLFPIGQIDLADPQHDASFREKAVRQRPEKKYGKSRQPKAFGFPTT